MTEIPTNLVADTTVRSAPVRVHYEPERFIYGSSDFTGTGRRWYGFTFDGPARVSFPVDLQSPEPNLPAELRFRVVNGAPRYSARVNVYLNGDRILGFTPESHTAPGERSVSGIGGDLQPGYNLVAFEQTEPNAKALFDWLEVDCFGALDRPRTFEAVDYTGVVRYQFSVPRELWIFEITDYRNVELAQAASITVPQETPTRRRFIAADPAEFEPVNAPFVEYFPSEADLGDLWSRANRADVILIAPDDYYDVLEPLLDHYASREPPLRGVRVRLSEIYNRFAGGMRDPAAIRNMLHYAQDYWSKPPDYVLFCGDGDYNYRDIDRSRSENLVPPYENGTTSSDDWFVDFSPDGGDLLPEMAIGRLTAASVWELGNMVEKIISYTEEPEFGTWRNRVTMVADDECGDRVSDEDEHVRGTEDICNNYLPAYLEKVKIYLTEYERQWGREKPRSGDDLIASINRGTVIVNYMGHGNPSLWAHEHVFVQSRDLPRIEPSRRLPLYLAFTCDWAYWDNPAGQSFPELLLARHDGGAIAVIASTRLTYSFSNTSLARNFFSSQFGEQRLTVAEALAIAKYQALISLGPTYHLLGDPTLYLGSPRLRGEFLSLQPYPLVPLALSMVTARVLAQGGGFHPDFDGELELVLLDSDVPRRYSILWYDYEGNEHEIVLNYNLLGSNVYHGAFSVTGGMTYGRFVVPRDITLGGGLGRLFGYFHDDRIDGIIALDSLHFAPTVAAAVDTVPPDIRVYFDHRGYRIGDPIGPEPTLIADISDSSGLNLTGVMGHGVSVSIDDRNPVDLTQSFSYHLDSYRSGSLEQRIGPLTAGGHTVEIQAWDSFNNLALKEFEVEVTAAAGGLMVDRVLNWPNPFRDRTRLTFIVNRPADFEARVYTVGGRLIWRYRGQATRAGLNADAVWDGRDRAGRTVANGVYLCKIIAFDDGGNRAEGLGRVVYAR